MIQTTTPGVDGRTITEYLGVVTGEAILGANIVREEVGAPTAEVLAAAPEYSLIRTS